MSTKENNSKVSTKLETTRTLTPQWKGAGNLGEFQVKTITPSVLEFNDLAQEFPEAIQEFLAGQLHIKFSGPKMVTQVREELEARHGKPEKGKSEEWHKLHASEAKTVAAAAASEVIDFGVELRAWASEWKAEGASVSAAGKLAAAQAETARLREASVELMMELHGMSREEVVKLLDSKLAK